MHGSRVEHAVSIDLSELLRQSHLLRQNTAKGRMRFQYRPELLRKLPLRTTCPATRGIANHSRELASRRSHHREHRRPIFADSGWGRSRATRTELWRGAGRNSELQSHQSK